MLSKFISSTLRTSYFGAKAVSTANTMNPIRMTHPRNFIPKGEKGRKQKENFKESPLVQTRDPFDIYEPIAIEEQ